MPKVTFGINKGGRIRIEVNYEDYKVWEGLLGKWLFSGIATESTTLVEGGRYWKLSDVE